MKAKTTVEQLVLHGGLAVVHLGYENAPLARVGPISGWKVTELSEKSEALVLRSPRAVSLILVSALAWPLAVVAMLLGGIALDRTLGVSLAGLGLVLVVGMGGSWLIVLSGLNRIPRIVRLRREGDELLIGRHRLPLGRGELCATAAPFHRLPIIRYRIGFRWPGSVNEQLLLGNCRDAPITRQFAMELARLGGWALRWRLPLDLDEGEARSPEQLSTPLVQRLSQEADRFQALSDLLAQEPACAEPLRAAREGPWLVLRPAALNFRRLWPLAALAMLLLGVGVALHPVLAGREPGGLETVVVGLAGFGVLLAIYVALVSAFAALRDEIRVSPSRLAVRRYLLGMPIATRELAADALQDIYEYRHALYHRLVVYAQGGQWQIFIGVVVRWHTLRCARLLIEAALVGAPVPEAVFRSRN